MLQKSQEENEVGNIPKTSRQKYITEEEYKKFLDVIEDERSYLLFLLCGNLGLRVGELVRLRVCDLMKDKQGFYLRVPTLKRNITKGVIKGTIKRGELPNSYEDIPLSSDLFKLAVAIQEHVKHNKFEKESWLFLEGDSHIAEYTAARYFKSYAKKAGLDSRYSIHSLRHFKGFQTYKIKQDLRAVQILLRHKDIKTSVIYSYADLDSKRRITEGLGMVR